MPGAVYPHRAMAGGKVSHPDERLMDIGLDVLQGPDESPAIHHMPCTRRTIWLSSIQKT